jgi:hypothetical protein
MLIFLKETNSCTYASFSLCSCVFLLTLDHVCVCVCVCVFGIQMIEDGMIFIKVVRKCATFSYTFFFLRKCEYESNGC